MYVANAYIMEDLQGSFAYCLQAKFRCKTNEITAMEPSGRKPSTVCLKSPHKSVLITQLLTYNDNIY